MRSRRTGDAIPPRIPLYDLYAPPLTPSHKTLITASLIGLRMNALQDFSVKPICHLNIHFVCAEFLPWGFPFIFVGLNTLQ